MRGCRPLSAAEVKLVLKHLRGRYRDRNRALFVLGLKSGLRVQSLLGLTLGSVWDGTTVLPRFYVERRTTKGRASGFSSPMHTAAAKALTLYITRHCSGLPHTAPLFWSSKKPNGALHALDRTAVWKLLKRAYRAASLRGRLACHTTRKTFAKNVYFALGHDLIATQKAMQHRSISSTIQYLSADQERVDRAILSI